MEAGGGVQPVKADKEHASPGQPAEVDSIDGSFVGSPVLCSRAGPAEAGGLAVFGSVETGLTPVRARCDPGGARAVERMDHDRLGVGVGGRVLLAGHGEHSPFGGFVGLEPLVEPLVGDFKGTSQRRTARDRFPCPRRGPRVSTSSKRGQPRLVSWARAIHESGDLRASRVPVAIVAWP